MAHPPLMNPLRLVFEFIQKTLTKCFQKRKRSQLEFSVEGQANNHGGGRCTSFTPTYKAIMFRIAQITDDRIWHLREQHVEYYDDQLGADVKESVYEMMQREPIEVEPDVFVQCEEMEEDRPSPNSSGTIRIRQSTVRVFSELLNVCELKNVVDRWMDEYKNFKGEQLRDKQLIFMVRFREKGEEEILYTDLHTHRTFNNLFFEEKDECLREIDFFLEEKEWYAKRGLQDSLGILGYGAPGCGKTSFIKALLKHTKRHAVIFSVNYNTNLESIERLMRTDTLCDFPIAQDKRVYVLEDVDAMGDLVTKRDKSDTPKMPLTGVDEMTMAGPKDLRTTLVESLSGTKKQEKDENTGEEKKSPMDKMDAMDSVLKVLSGFGRKGENHLSFLLNLLDGVIETKGRIIVMTTNHVDKLDPALIRPGRIDIKVEFKKCSRIILSQILGHFYKTDPKILLQRFPEHWSDYLFTPAEIARMCRANKTNLEGALSSLEEEYALLMNKTNNVLPGIDTIEEEDEKLEKVTDENRQGLDNVIDKVLEA